MRSKSIIGVAILAMVLMVSGCLTITVDSKVNKDASIEKYSLQMEMGSNMYDMLNNAGERTLKETAEERGATYTEEWNRGNVTIIMAFNNPGPESINVTSEVQGDYIIYRDNITADLIDRAMDETTSDYSTNLLDAESPIKKHYYLEMPGEIVDSNADVVNGNKAEWNMVEAGDSRPIYAKSEIPLLPGFSSLMGIIVLLGLIFVTSRR
ncbi:hypothetical protein [Methanohalophilus euhalobius]|uniref:Uncharacterized protein n=1 Tax=Methanohalophilus euhalobius TaxID=51203 RepID=A0A315A1C3_9EURY|nr:hypothetical protein [Methanohalophilus euhalobius]PQV43367.1 hypothetical protein B0H22_10289 [Methanohalophilus euhalobius]RNI07569.1 hypothetical protein EDD83_08480 [Methanohalophilus euhalobius]